MAAVLTTTMTLRIILAVRGSLAQGGSYAGSSFSSSARANSTHVLSSAGRTPQPAHPTSLGPTASSFGVESRGVVNINSPTLGERKGSLGAAQKEPALYALDEVRDKRDWNDGSDGRSSVMEGKEGEFAPQGYGGVKVTIDREVDYAGRKWHVPRHLLTE